MNKKYLVIFFLIFTVLIILNTCRQNINKIELREIGFIMPLPTGWQVDSKDKTFFYQQLKKDENFGWIDIYELAPGESLVDLVDSLIVDLQNFLLEEKASLSEYDTLDLVFDFKVLQKKITTISNRPAIELISEFDGMLYEVYILNNDLVIQVSFRISKDDFKSYESTLQNVINSIQFRK